MSHGSPALRATSAGVTKMPEPTMPPITISVASNRPMRRAKVDAMAFAIRKHGAALSAAAAR